MEEQLPEVNFIKGVRMEAIEQEDDRTFVTLNEGSVIEADAIILTTGHAVARHLFEPHGVLQDLEDIKTSSVATITLAFPERAVVQDKEGTGFLVSRSGDYSITACTWLNRKWPTTTPDGKVLLRAFVGRIGEEAIVDLPDDEIEQIVLGDLRKIFEIKEEPEFSIVTRWKDDRPQYRVGHKQLIAKAKEQLHNTFPNVELAGASYEGVGLPDCVDQGKAAAESVMQRLTN